MITIQDFQKIDLRIAEVLEAEEITESEKLIKLKVSTGEEERIIVAGIKKSYTPEDLIGKQIIIVANLEPKEIQGIQSQGMLLAASEDNEPVLLRPDKKTKNGAHIR